MEFDSPAEAFATIAALVVAADAVGTQRERDYLFGDVRTLAVFASLDDDAYARLVERAAARIAEEHGTSDGGLDASVADSVADGARAVLDETQRLQALGMARSIAGVDSTDLGEGDLLEHLRVGLEA